MSTSSSDEWRTSITEIAPNRVAVRGHEIAGLMGRTSFGQAVYLILKGSLPGPKIGHLIDAMLVSGIDHGVTPPSALSARIAASTGATLSASVAAGVMSINRWHGGAVEDCARELRRIVELASDSGRSVDDAARTVLEELKAEGRRMSGFGHRIHDADPRTSRLFELAGEAGVSGRHVEAAHAVGRTLETMGRRIPINVDGAMAAILADLEFDPGVMNGIFMIARVPGLIAHVREEQTRERPMRRIDPTRHTYDGPPTATGSE